MNTDVLVPRVPVSRSLVEREAKRVVQLNATIIDQADACINEILNDEKMAINWAKHADPVFDEESQEGSVDIDKVRLADIVREWAAAHKGRYPLIDAARTNRLKNAVQRALARTSESVTKRRNHLKAAS